MIRNHFSFFAWSRSRHLLAWSVPSKKNNQTIKGHNMDDEEKLKRIKRGIDRLLKINALTAGFRIGHTNTEELECVIEGNSIRVPDLEYINTYAIYSLKRQYHEKRVGSKWVKKPLTTAEEAFASIRQEVAERVAQIQL